MIRLLFVSICLPALAFGVVFDVQPGESIRQAVNSAADGDTVLIHDGDYSETVIPYGKDLTIASLFLLDGDSSHISGTTMRPDTCHPDTSSCFVYAYGETIACRLVGLTLADGRGTRWVLGSESWVSGGAVYLYLSAVSIEACRVVNASAYLGGGIAVAFQDTQLRSTLALANCSFRGCSANTWGGAVYANRCTLRVEDCVMDSNQSLAEGGAISALQCVASISGCTFRNNTSSAAVAIGSSTGLIAECEFRDNSVHAPGFGDTDLVLANGLFSATRCHFFPSPVQAPAVELNNLLQGSSFSGNVIEHHSAGVGSSGTLHTCTGREEISYNILRQNDNTTTGAIHAFDHSRTHVHHNMLLGNRSNPGAASVLSALTFARPILDSNIVQGNAGPTIEYNLNDPGTIDARNNWWGDASGPYHPTLNPSGQGDTLLSDSVLFIPWLTSPPDTTMPSHVREGKELEIASTWELFGLYPNPFNSRIRIVIAGFTGRNFRLTLHNLLGQEVAQIHTGPLTGGELSFQAPPSLASGIYFVRATEGRTVQTRKAIFLK